MTLKLCKLDSQSINTNTWIRMPFVQADGQARGPGATLGYQAPGDCKLAAR